MLFRTNRAAILAHLAVKILANATEDLIKAARTYCRDQSIQATERDLQSVANEALQTRSATQTTQLTSMINSNSIPFSRNLADESWTISGSAPTYDQVGVEGASHTATKLTDAGGFASATVQVAVPDDTNTHVLRVYIKKDTDTTRFPGIQFTFDVGNAGVLTTINTQTGAVGDIQSSAGGTTTVRDPGGDWWELLLSITNPTGETAVNVYIFPARSTTIGVNNEEATGSCIIGNVEMYLNKSVVGTAAGTFTFTP